MAQALASSPWRANAVSLSKLSGAPSRGSARGNTAIMMATVSAADLPASLAASTNRVLRSLRTSTGRVCRQISRSPSQCPASRRPSTASGRSWMERRPAIMVRGCRARRWPRLARPLDEGVDGLAGDGAELALLAALQPARDLLRRPAFQQPLADEPGELGV